ncbi:hypothetical protein SAMN04487898_109225 [Pedobacter sp. ok626]|nr:hypothetical protein SAMN04487898_109225 [Pedobacter sp. ok626]
MLKNRKIILAPQVLGLIRTNHNFHSNNPIPEVAITAYPKLIQNTGY